MKGIFNEAKGVYQVNNLDGTFDTYTPAQFREKFGVSVVVLEKKEEEEEEEADIIIDATQGAETTVTPSAETTITNTPNTQI